MGVVVAVAVTGVAGKAAAEEEDACVCPDSCTTAPICKRSGRMDERVHSHRNTVAGTAECSDGGPTVRRESTFEVKGMRANVRLPVQMRACMCARAPVRKNWQTEAARQ